MKKKICLFIILIVLIALIGVFVYLFVKNKNSNESREVIEVVSLDTIEGYNYHLNDRDSEVYKKYFYELKTILSDSESIDFEAYAKVLSSMYVIDLYSLYNKLNKYDVTVSDFINPENIDNFRLKVSDTLYKYLEDDTNGKRNQELPKVKEVNVEEVSNKSFKIDEIEYSGYVVKLSWSYEKDLGYDTEATLDLIKRDNKIYVLKQI